MQCPSCGLQIDQPNTTRCPRCGYQLAPSAGQYGPGSSSAGGYGHPEQGGGAGSTGGYPPQAPTSPYGSYGTGATPQNPQGQQGQYGSYAPPSGYGQPAAPSGYGQPYGQPAPPSYPVGQGYPPAGFSQQPYAPPPKKSRTGLVVGIIVAVVVVLVACTGVIIFALASIPQTATTAGVGTTTTGATPTPSETVIYGNTFKSDATGWAQDAGHCFLGSDGYHASNGYLCYAPIGSQSDFNVSVSVQQVSGPTTTGYGIVLRRESAGNYYDFLIDSNGKWFFDKCVDNKCTTLVDFTANGAIKGGLKTTNTIKVVASGSHFDFFVNDTQVGSQDDATFASGKVGVEGGDTIDCVFTDFIVSRSN